ncbi:MAG: DUF6512 family protein [Candidatus Nanopelagicales bacterium]|jgi:hypothetical protein|nr:DUF6512 family protein [Candidatus Nanopelagicales bacterium]
MARATVGADRDEPRAAPRPPPAWLGLAFLLVVGSVWHFVHAASGGWAPIGLVAPVNESVWEHTKLVAIPMLLWAAIVGWRTGHMASALVGGVVGGLAGAGLMVVGYYAYVAVLGYGWFPMDIGLFVLCSLAALAVLGRVRLVPARGWLAAALVTAELALFAVLTVAPPDWPVFVPAPR